MLAGSWHNVFGTRSSLQVTHLAYDRCLIEGTRENSMFYNLELGKKKKHSDRCSDKCSEVTVLIDLTEQASSYYEV